MKAFYCGVRLTVLLFNCGVAPAAGEVQSLEFEMRRDHRIIIQGHVKDLALRLLVDTGSTHNILDHRVVRQLGLRPLGGKAEVQAFGKKTTAERVFLAGLQLGSHVSSLLCWVHDLSNLEVDAILGLTFLRQQNLTIDFRRCRIQQGADYDLPHQIPFEEHPSLVVVKVILPEKALRLSVDTGLPRLLFYKDRVPRWGRSTRTRPVAHLNGMSSYQELWITQVQLGTQTFGDLSAYLSTTHPRDPDRDGNLGPRALGLTRLHFDFGQKSLGWD